jgi:hypothetical protein
MEGIKKELTRPAYCTHSKPAKAHFREKFHPLKSITVLSHLLTRRIVHEDDGIAMESAAETSDFWRIPEDRRDDPFDERESRVLRQSPPSCNTRQADAFSESLIIRLSYIFVLNWLAGLNVVL